MYNKHIWWKEGCGHLSMHCFSALSSEHNVNEDPRCRLEDHWSEQQFIHLSVLYTYTIHVKYNSRNGKSEATAETSGETISGC